MAIGMAKSSSMIVAGLMSGTSADGIDVAMVRIAPRQGGLAIEMLAHREFPFPRALRDAVLRAMNAAAISTAELAQLNWRLGLAYADALGETMRDTGIRPDLAGCHGQTIYHQSTPAPYAGRRFACTWQLGEPALIAAACGVPVVSNFRPIDMALGGQGAPLVPLFDYVYFAHPKRARVLQNIGGIGNLTVIPAGAPQEKVIAFDTGPGNMVIDALMQKLFGKHYDRDGRTAAQGEPVWDVVHAALKEKFFRSQPPKSAGREQFGAEYAARLLAACRKRSRKPKDAIATATALTAMSIAQAFECWVQPLTGNAPVDFVVSGGGAKNSYLLKALNSLLSDYHCTVTTSEAMGLPASMKEAAAFALLAYETWHHRPGNVPSATGASRPAILGQITYA
jgi:anhydro-N-acetylmuramic acid kinase